jgi:hypothetical protein
MHEVDIDDQLTLIGQQCLYDPLTWVRTVFPWGEAGSFLEHEQGPDEWQTELLEAIGEELKAAALRVDGKSTAQIAVGAGRGCGKSALMSWMILFFMATRPNPAVVVTAGTEVQLRTKLWREVNKWLTVSAVAHWFDWQATSLRLKSDPNKWVANAIPWSEYNPHAFAGTHENNVAYFFDEGSVVADNIYETSEGAFTTPGGLWLVFGNRTQNSGRFNAFFEKPSKYWRTMVVDVRRSRKADKAKIAEWLERYGGEDSDFCRVHIRGLPPKGGDNRLITVDDVESACYRDIHEQWIGTDVPLVMGVDPAGGGVSVTAIVLRRGPLIKPEWIIRFSESNQMRVVSLIAAQISKWRPDYVTCDASGIGKPMVDRLHQLGYYQVIPVYGGDIASVEDKLRYTNCRAEWFGRFAEWIKVSSIPNDRELRDEILAQPVDRDARGRLKLMSKMDMRKEGLTSPDTLDAACMTFAQHFGMRISDDDSYRGDGIPEVS